MSDFLLIVPEGWTELNLDAVTQIPGVSTSALENWIANGQMEYITASLVDGGLLPIESVVVDAKLFNGTNFVVMLG